MPEMSRMPAVKGRVDSVLALIERGRLKVRLEVATTDGRQLSAFLPDRELSALLPRSLLLTSLGDVPPELLKTIEPMLCRLVKGRQVRLWSYSERLYASFLPWRSVRFAAS